MTIVYSFRIAFQVIFMQKKHVIAFYKTFHKILKTDHKVLDHKEKQFTTNWTKLRTKWTTERGHLETVTQ